MNGVILAAAMLLASSAAPLYDTDKSVPCVCAEDFSVDGDISKPVWSAAKPVADFTVRRGEALPVEVRALYSRTALYFAARLEQPMAKLTAKLDQDDLGIYDDDSLEIFLYIPGPKKDPRFVHMAVNANGNIYDACDGRTGFKVKGMALEVRRHETDWTIEMKLPYAGFPMDRPFAGDAIGVRFCRNAADPQCVSSFPALTKSAHNRREDFAKLDFLMPAGLSAEVEKEAAEYRRAVTERRERERYQRLRDRLDRSSAAVAGIDRTVPVLAEAHEAVKRLRGKFRDQVTDDFEAEFDRVVSGHEYLVWNIDPWAVGTPDDRPPQDYKRVESISFEQAGNERGIVALAFESLMLPRLDLRIVTHSIGRGRDKLPRDVFEVYEEKLLRYDNQFVAGPLAKLTGDIVTLTPGVPTRVWIIFNSKGVKPGEYNTAIDLKPAWDESVPVQKIAVKARVRNFALPETRDWPLKSFFWGPNMFQDDEVETLRLMHSHHVTHGWTKTFKYWHGLTDEGSILGKDGKTFKRELAEHANEEFFREAKKLRMRFVMGWNSPTCWEWYDAMIKRLRGMGFEYEDFVFKALIADEFKKDSIPTLAAVREEVAKHIPKETWFQAVYLSTPPPSGATIEDIEAAKLPEFYRMWTLISDLTTDKKRGPETVARLRAKGCSVWDYHCGLHMHPRSALGYYRHAPRLAYLCGLDGTAMWHSGIRRGDDGYDVADGTDDGVFWVGPDRRFVTTAHFEAYCQGLEDVAYCDLLKKALEKAKAAGRNLPECEKLIDDYAVQTKKLDQAAIDRWRRSAGEAIEASL